MTQRVILIGYRGTGKSTVGRLVADRLGWEFADADAHLEAAAGRSIAAVFAEEGEAGFRDREAATLRELCLRDRVVIATGGGAVLRSENRELLGRSGLVVWLTASPETLWRRLRSDPTTTSRRPNLTPTGGLEEIRTLLSSRTPLYRELADLCFDTETLSPEAVAAAILSACTGGPNRRSSSGAPGSSPSA